MATPQHRDLDRRDRRQVARDLVPALALVGAREHLAGARAEVEAGHVERVDRHPLAQHAEVRVALRQAAVEPLPGRAGVARAPDRGLPVGHAAPVAGVERDHVEGVPVVRVRGGGEAELGRQALGDLRSTSARRRRCGACRQWFCWYMRLVVDRRHHELVDAVADLGILERPVGAQALVARRPRGAVVRRLEDAEALDDGPEAGRRRPGAGGSPAGRDGPGGWFAGSFQSSRPGWPSSVLSSDQVRAAVAALEDAGRLGAGEQAPVRRRQARDLRQLQLAVAVGEALARQLPRLAEVVAAPDAGAVPLARRGRVDRAGCSGRARRGRSASPRRYGPRTLQSRRSSSLSSTKQPLRVPTSRTVRAIRRTSRFDSLS